MAFLVLADKVQGQQIAVADVLRRIPLTPTGTPPYFGIGPAPG
jgi:hypothetical protein